MANNLSSVVGFIFDLDGTLMHSNLDFNYLRQAIQCNDDCDILHHISQLPPDIQNKANQIVIEHELDDARNAQWMEGALPFIETLFNLSIPMAIVTRNCRQAAELKLAKYQSRFVKVVTREDAPAKPDPTALLEIAADWQCKPADLAYVGDYLYDVEAANRAGMVSCLLVQNGLPDYADQAKVVFEDFSELRILVCS